MYDPYDSGETYKPTYERMTYGHDQRAWMKNADDNLPVLLETTRMLQEQSAEVFKVWDGLQLAQKAKMTFMPHVIHDANQKALNSLRRVIYLQGMRLANLPAE